MNLPLRLSGDTPADVVARIEVVDSDTGSRIDRVIEANPMTGHLRRFAVDNGNLVRRDDAFVILAEERPHELRWVPAPDGDGSPREEEA